ncbi:MAG TPA: sigma-70 family RNA polymerase sigma factor [Gemmatimonadaceae bacterium]|jgi:RNA polymerase sigma factor (sigma-70 family)|nr:sigma-70 family RNA polymerase sigma factor [Gemmatimonadaceae bacterium]
MTVDSRDLSVADLQARLARLFDQHYDALCGYALRWGTRHLEDAEDVVQDAFTLLSADHPVLTAPDDRRPLAYLYTVVRGRMMNGARDLALTRRHTERHWADMQAALGPIPFPTPSALLESKEWQAWWEEALSQLPPRSREIIELRLAGFSYVEIAEQLGITPGTVNTLVVRAYRQLRDYLHGHGPPPEWD